MLSQNEPITHGCVGDNVTLEFKPDIDESLPIETYVWHKLDVNGDTSFAKFTNKSKKWETYFPGYEERLVHNPDNKSEINNLILKNVQKSDASRYQIVIRYTDFSGKDPEYTMKLEVKGQYNYQYRYLFLLLEFYSVIQFTLCLLLITLPVFSALDKDMKQRWSLLHSH